MENRLFEFTMRVLYVDGCELPEGARGAYIPCYSCAPDYQSALRKGVAAIGATGCRFDDIKGPAREIPASDWASYVAKVWPDAVNHLPSQAELSSMIVKGSVFFGPFAVFDDGDSSGS
jgi:hypothetical protein